MSKKPNKEPEPSARELLEVIKNQQQEIRNIKDAHNKLVDAFTELADNLAKGAGKGGGLAEIAMVLKSVAPLLKGSESDPFRDIGVFTFKQFLKSSMGAKMGKKAIAQMFKEEKGEKEEGKEEEE